MTLSVMVHDHKNLYFIAIAMRLFVHQNGSDYPGRKYVNITFNIYSNMYKQYTGNTSINAAKKKF